jgi:hypothetical protein
MTVPNLKTPLQHQIYNFLLANPGSTPEQIAVGTGRTERGILTALSYMGQYSHHLVANGPSVNELHTVHYDGQGRIFGIASSDDLGLGVRMWAQSFPHACVNADHAAV